MPNNLRMKLASEHIVVGPLAAAAELRARRISEKGAKREKDSNE